MAGVEKKMKQKSQTNEWFGMRSERMGEALRARHALYKERLKTCPEVSQSTWPRASVLFLLHDGFTHRLCQPFFSKTRVSHSHGHGDVFFPANDGVLRIEKLNLKLKKKKE